MALFQTPPRTPAEVEAAKPLGIPPDEVLPMDEAEWYARVYRGDDVPQLTVRAILMGSILGFFLAFTNLYIGLKTGWHLGVAITACILAFAISNALVRFGWMRSSLTILETNCMQSTASAAGYSTGGTMVSAIPALLMLSVTEVSPKGVHLDWQVLALWTFFVAVLGCVMAIPMKRNMINKERLKFPSGTAAAVTLQSLYSEGSEAVKKARALLYSALTGALFPLLIDLQCFTKEISDKATGAVKSISSALLPGHSNIFDWLPARGSRMVDGKDVPFVSSDWTMVLDHNPVMIAAGMIVGLRVTVYMLLSALALIFVLGPEAYGAEWVSQATGLVMRAASHPGKAWKEIGIWFGVPIMVSYALLSFALQWRTIGRAFRGLRGGPGGDSEEVRRTEAPGTWFLWGTALAGIGIVWIANRFFEVPLHYGMLAVFMTFFLALVACRATGETDITPTGGMGKIMQLTYGVLIPQSTTANLMTAGITAGSAAASADLLNDLKSGYLLGANPRRQFLAQFFGIFTGTLATVIGFYLLVPDVTALTGTVDKAADFPAPAAQAWKAVAEVFKRGLENMHPMHRQALFWGAGLGAVMLALEQLLPRAKRWLPSATGIGLGMILPFQYPFAMFVGALLAWVWSRRNRKSHDLYMIAVASGVIAGISIMGVIVAMLNNLAF
jgi:uncharacterized oligopeptide transporter (OPT) family protein